MPATLRERRDVKNSTISFRLNGHRGEREEKNWEPTGKNSELALLVWVSSCSLTVVDLVWFSPGRLIEVGRAASSKWNKPCEEMCGAVDSGDFCTFSRLINVSAAVGV